MKETVAQNLKSVPCSFCGRFLVYANCNKISFPVGDYLSEIEFKKAKYFDIVCGICHETTKVRNPKFQYWK